MYVFKSVVNMEDITDCAVADGVVPWIRLLQPLYSVAGDVEPRRGDIDDTSTTELRDVINGVGVKPIGVYRPSEHWEKADYRIRFDETKQNHCPSHHHDYMRIDTHSLTCTLPA